MSVASTGTASGRTASAPVSPIVMPAAGGAPWTADDIARLDGDLDAMLANDRAVRGAHLGIVAIDTATATPIYTHNADDAFQPASTLKLLVGSAALERLGPAFRFHTEAYERGAALGELPRMTARNVLAGDVVLRGGGDPFLTASDVDAFARATHDAGISAMSSLVIDATRYDDRPYANGWTWDDFAQDYAAPVSAMTVEENVMHVSVAPRAPGDAAVISASPLPDHAGFFLENCEGFFEPNVETAVRTGAMGSETTLDVERDTRNCATVTGLIAAGSGNASIDVAVPDANVYAYLIAHDALKRNGVDAGRYFSYAKPYTYATSVAKPAGAPVVWTHDSPSLASFLGPRFWIPSDNLVGELLLKELGFQTAGRPGTTANGIAFETLWLRSIGVDPVTVTLADGCGMSQYDRITPRDLVAILQHDWNGPNRQLVLDALPVGGARGTIEGIAGTPAAGRVFAKTGSMMHVRGLAGYLAPKRHGAVTFAFEVDDWLGDYASLAAVRAAMLSRIADDGVDRAPAP